MGRRVRRDFGLFDLRFLSIYLRTIVSFFSFGSVLIHVLIYSYELLRL